MNSEQFLFLLSRFQGGFFRRICIRLVESGLIFHLFLLNLPFRVFICSYKQVKPCVQCWASSGFLLGFG